MGRPAISKKNKAILLNLYESFLSRYKVFTEIQKLAIPIIENGSNCIIIAPTGSGKTEAAVLPALKKVIDSGTVNGISLLYITPLRALNRDMIKRLEEFCNSIGISIAVRHGDTKQSERSRQAKKAPQMLITTPETLQSILPTKYLGSALKNVKVVIIDEIHELYFNKRGAQLSIALERLEELAPNFQRIGISATVGNSKVVGEYLSGDRRFEVAEIKKVKDIKLSIRLPMHYDKALAHLGEKFGLDSASLSRLDAIAGEIRGAKSVLIFCNTRQIVEALGSRLIYLNSTVPFGGIGVHHSSLDKSERIHIEDAFKDGALKSIIATSSLELGIDIGSIDLVIQYGSPRQALRLAQRIGRSGHAVSRSANGSVIALNAVDAIETAAVYRNVMHGSIEVFNMQVGALDVLANQICGITLDKGAIGLDELGAIIGRSKVYSGLERSVLKSLVEFMGKQHMIGFDGNVVSSGGRTRMYYYDHLSVLPDSKRFLVKSIINNRIISTLDDRFVANNIDENSVFITKGLPWKVVSIDSDAIMVEPSTDLEAAVPDWSGEDIPVSRSVAKSFIDILNAPESIDTGLFRSEEYRAIMEFIDKQKQFSMMGEGLLPIESYQEYKVMYTGLGTLANEAISRMLGNLISLKMGRSINIKASPYMVFIEVPKSIDLKSIMLSINPSLFEDSLRNAVQDTELFVYKFMAIAKVFGIVDRDAVVSKSMSRRLIRLFKDSPPYAETLRELMKNYFDLDSVKGFLRDLNSGRSRLVQVDLDKMSPLTSTILNSAYYTKELIVPLTPSNELLNSFVEFMMSKEIKLICTYCGFRFTRSIKDLGADGQVLCPSCGSPMIAIEKAGYEKIIKKRAKGAKLGSNEKAELDKMLKEANMIKSYGQRGIIALSTYGIGPKSAARALMMLKPDNRLFYMDIIESQKQFIKNKKYWRL